MYGLGDDIQSLSEGIRNTRKLLKKAYKAIIDGNIDLAKELLRQSDQAALDGLCMVGEGDKKGLDGKKIKPKWLKD